MALEELEEDAMGPQEASERIWLKQTVQFSVSGQMRTIEITLPVRPGAPPEEIERLLRQADAGLDQMTQHLNKKVEEIIQQTQVSAARSTPLAHSGLAGAGEPPSAAGTRAMPARVPEGAGRLGARSSEPVAPVGSPSLERKQFIAEIAVLGLNPRQAMERLGVRSLDGVNLRQALEQLRLQLLHERSAIAGGPSAPVEEGRVSSSGGSSRMGSAGNTESGPLRQPSEGKHGPQLSLAHASGSMAARPALDGALSLDEEGDAPGDEVSGEEGENKRRPERLPTLIPIRGGHNLISLQERGKAQLLLERLRRLRGRLYPPSSDNLKAFRNVVEQQLGAEKTATLLYAIWRVSQPEQLSPEQLAECIRWGKSDLFEEEVDTLLQLTATEEA